VLPVDVALGHARIQHLEPLLALAAADDLADPRRQHIHCRARSAVIVHPHVEGFDVLRAVHHDDRLLRVLFSQIPLMLRRGEANALSSLVTFRRKNNRPKPLI
jgi:hypothetical protein